jgi:hypothetical protein
MRTVQAIFFLFIWVAIGVGIFNYLSSSQPDPLGHVRLGTKSDWFRSADSGEKCRAIFTCIVPGAQIKGLYLDQGELRFELGELPGETTLSTCEGGKNGVSLEVFPEVKNGGVVVRLSEGSNPVEVYRFDLPRGYSPAQKAEAVLVFNAERGSGSTKIIQTYEQTSLISDCGKESSSPEGLSGPSGLEMWSTTK